MVLHFFFFFFFFFVVVVVSVQHVFTTNMFAQYLNFINLGFTIDTFKSKLFFFFFFFFQPKLVCAQLVACLQFQLYLRLYEKPSWSGFFFSVNKFLVYDKIRISKKKFYKTQLFPWVTGNAHMPRHF